MKYDVIKTGEFTYRLIDKETKEPVNISQIIADKFDAGEIKK